MWLVKLRNFVWHRAGSAIRTVSLWRFSAPGAYGTFCFCGSNACFEAGRKGGRLPGIGLSPSGPAASESSGGASAPPASRAKRDCSGARQCSAGFPPDLARPYGTGIPVPYKFSQSSQSRKSCVLAPLLSRPPKCPNFLTYSRSAASFPQLPSLPGNLFVYVWLRGVVGRRSGDVRNCGILRHCVHGKTPAKRPPQRIAATRTAAWLSLALCRSPAAL